MLMIVMGIVMMMMVMVMVMNTMETLAHMIMVSN
jgi:hypothetical protein